MMRYIIYPELLENCCGVILLNPKQSAPTELECLKLLEIVAE